MDDRSMFERIQELSREEDELWERAGDGDGLSQEQRERLASIRTELDRCHDLLRRRDEGKVGGAEPPSAQP